MMVATNANTRTHRQLPLIGMAWVVVRIGVGWFWLDQGTAQARRGAAAVGTIESVAGVAIILGILVGVSASVALMVGWTGIATVAGTHLAIDAAAVAATLSLIWGWKVAGTIGFDHWLLARVRRAARPVERGTTSVAPQPPVR